jgi:hypothetical protein
MNYKSIMKQQWVCAFVTQVYHIDTYILKKSTVRCLHQHNL